MMNNWLYCIHQPRKISIHQPLDISTSNPRNQLTDRKKNLGLIWKVPTLHPHTSMQIWSIFFNSRPSQKKTLPRMSSRQTCICWCAYAGLYVAEYALLSSTCTTNYVVHFRCCAGTTFPLSPLSVGKYLSSNKLIQLEKIVAWILIQKCQGPGSLNELPGRHVVICPTLLLTSFVSQVQKFIHLPAGYL